MFKSHNEYVRDITNARYKLFEVGDRNSKPYIHLSVGFYAGCSYHPGAWNETFKSLRNHFPTEPLVMFQDGFAAGFDYTSMAQQYNATYLIEKEGIYLFWPQAEQCWRYLQWILQVADICNTEWLVQLHPDNIINDRFHINPPGPLCGVGAGSHNGVSNNPIPEHAQSYIRTLHPSLESNGYGWCGGGCIHVPTFRAIMKDFTFEKLVHIKHDVNETVTRHEDMFLPFLFNMYGFPYRVWLEIEEHNRGYHGLGQSAAIQHANKTYYNLDPKTLEYKIINEVLAEKNMINYNYKN